MGRIIIFTGKGGVGKSSIAAAHGVKAAKEGKKTIIVSTDMAHNLGDIFNINMTSEPVKIMENLSLLEIDPHSEIDGEYRSLVDTIITAFMGSGEKADVAKDISFMPGMDELFSLIKVKDLYESNDYDLIIVDCAPTG